MKKILLFLVLVTSVFSISCKKIPDVPGRTTKTIVGKNWKLTAYTVNGVDELSNNYEPCDLDDHWIFRADGKFILDHKNTTCGDEILFDGDIVTWSIVDNKLYVMNEFTEEPDMNFTMDFDILNLSAKILKIVLIIPEDTENADDEGDADGPYHLTYTFTAQ